MQTSMLVFCLVLAAFAPGQALEMSPIAKVISMIADLEAKVQAEGQATQKTYEEFSELCEGRSKELNFEVKTGTANADELKATIAKGEADIISFNAKIEELVAAIATAEADLKAATEIRAKEAAEFAEEEKELVVTIDELTGGISKVEQAMGSGASMLQFKGAQGVTKALSAMVEASAFSAADGKRLAALVQSGNNNDSDDELAAPEGAAYSSHSGGIVDTLNSLLERAKTQLEDARNAEKKAIYDFDMLKESLADEIRYGGMDMERAKKDLAEAEQSKATAEGDLSVTEKDLAEDTATLADLHTSCMSKANAFEVETTERGEELKALATAKKIVEEATSGAEAQTYGLNQVSFLEVSTHSNKGFEVVRFVRRLAQKHHSTALAQLASHMASAVGSRNGANPFDKIKGLIMDMIGKLEKEAQEDAEKKGYCDKEMSETEAKKADKEAEIEKLSTKIDQDTTASEGLKEEVAVLQKELAELAATQASMNDIRTKEKTDFANNKAEMDQGIAGIKLALKTLRDYYAQGDATSSSDAGGGIISMLEVAESDLTKNLQEMTTEEETAAAEYDKQTKDNEMTKTTKSQDVKYKTKEAKGLDESVSESSSDRSNVQTELDAVNEYYAKIKAECVAKADTYEEIKARREAEIAGLKEGIEILESESALIQKTTKHITLRGKRA